MPVSLQTSLVPFSSGGRSYSTNQSIPTRAAFCLNDPRRPATEHRPISNDPFASLQQRFLARCADRLVELKAARERRAVPGSSSGDTLIGIAHSLAGGAGTFGFPDISVRASELETLLIERSDVAHTALDALIAEIERTLK
ncbi:Hpt domain-containing protein [Mesorhizobium ciceri]|uniref:Hpt domain-containing protein n=1 Tax=Mesorhizobium TaxID=68287 RepID=UPI0009E02C6E|nr:Hpt domain-containing protein [Mesorhizobium ciceri]